MEAFIIESSFETHVIIQSDWRAEKLSRGGFSLWRLSKWKTLLPQARAHIPPIKETSSAPQKRGILFPSRNHSLKHSHHNVRYNVWREVNRPTGQRQPFSCPLVHGATSIIHVKKTQNRESCTFPAVAPFRWRYGRRAEWALTIACKWWRTGRRRAVSRGSVWGRPARRSRTTRRPAAAGPSVRSRQGCRRRTAPHLGRRTGTQTRGVTRKWKHTSGTFFSKHKRRDCWLGLALPAVP